MIIDDEDDFPPLFSEYDSSKEFLSLEEQVNEEMKAKGLYPNSKTDIETFWKEKGIHIMDPTK